MANTQTTVPLFVANQVLTAAQQNASAGTGVPVFATTVTRDAAFGGSNKALAEGQLCYIEASDIVQYYTGAAWATVGPASGGLALVTAETAFTTAASVSLAASTFTSTYRNYRVIFQLSAASTTLTITSRLRASGTDSSSALYNQMSTGLTQTAAASNRAESNASSWTMQPTFTTGYWGLVLDVLNPVAATVTQIQGQLTADDAATFVGRSVNGIYNATTSYDAMSFIASTGTITGTYAVYGYSK